MIQYGVWHKEEYHAIDDEHLGHLISDLYSVGVIAGNPTSDTAPVERLEDPHIHAKIGKH